jgi:hypothetical protein
MAALKLTPSTPDIDGLVIPAGLPGATFTPARAKSGKPVTVQQIMMSDHTELGQWVASCTQPGTVVRRVVSVRSLLDQSVWTRQP